MEEARRIGDRGAGSGLSSASNLFTRSDDSAAFAARGAVYADAPSQATLLACNDVRDGWSISYGPRGIYETFSFDRARALQIARDLHGTIEHWLPEGIMELLLMRDPQETCTIGDLTMDGKHVCWICEDAERPVKIKGQTAIPRGRYRIDRTFSNRFQHTMPQLMDVPDFEGIRIHPGNTIEDTAGCLLPGLVKFSTSVGQSVLAFQELSQIINEAANSGEEVWITIAGPQ